MNGGQKSTELLTPTYISTFVVKIKQEGYSNYSNIELLLLLTTIVNSVFNSSKVQEIFCSIAFNMKTSIMSECLSYFEVDEEITIEPIRQKESRSINIR